MGDLYAAGPELAYESRLQTLLHNKIALWDVIASCHRPGSLDSDISKRGLLINDFTGFLTGHPDITHICFNGQKAASLFNTMVAPGLAIDLEMINLPSTSPAHAAKSYADKLEAWAIIKTL